MHHFSVEQVALRWHTGGLGGRADEGFSVAGARSVPEVGQLKAPQKAVHVVSLAAAQIEAWWKGWQTYTERNIPKVPAPPQNAQSYNIDARIARATKAATEKTIDNNKLKARQRMDKRQIAELDKVWNTAADEAAKELGVSGGFGNSTKEQRKALANKLAAEKAEGNNHQHAKAKEGKSMGGRG
jgi:hypothetical protein